MVDHIQWVESEDLRKDARKHQEDQAKLNQLVRREGTTVKAKREVKKELDELPRKPSKKDTRSELRRKREEEMAALRSQDLSFPEDRAADGHRLADMGHSQAACDAMESFMREFA